MLGKVKVSAAANGVLKWGVFLEDVKKTPSPKATSSVRTLLKDTWPVYYKTSLCSTAKFILRKANLGP